MTATSAPSTNGIDHAPMVPASKRATASVAPPAPSAQIKPPEFAVMHLPIQNMPGSPLVVNAFSSKARETMRATQEAGSVGKKNKIREGKDFEAAYQNARHIAVDGWDGVSANAFRASAIDACRLCGFQMTVGRRALFVEPDGVSATDGTPLVRIHGEPVPFEAMVRNATGVADIRIRPRWDVWRAVVRIRFDAQLFSAEDVLNLMWRAGEQNGICEGRPGSKGSFGQGWGLFQIDTAHPIEITKVERKAFNFVMK